MLTQRGPMSTNAPPRRSLAGLVAHVRTPLYRNAYAWLISTGLSSGLGILYWVLAARLYTPAVVGFSAALVSSMIFIAGVSQLNLMSALVRFLPVAGPRSARFAATAYGLSLALALIVSTLFAILSNYIQGLDFYLFNLRSAVLFILATMAWTVFNLQDSVLTGLRASVWVPVDNIAYGVAKIVALAVLAPRLPTWGIFVSWTVPALVLLLPFNWLIFARLIPRHVRTTAASGGALRVRQIGKYIASNYLGSLFTLTTGRLLPTLVVALAGTTAAAYFYLAWTISNSLKLATAQMATSLTVEGALDRATIAHSGAKFLRLMLGLFVPGVLALVLGAPLLLRLSGPDYSAQGALLLRLLSLAILPALVVSWYLSVARVRHQLREIILAEGSLAVLTLGLSYVLIRQSGVTGVGVAALVSASIVALALAPRIWLTLRPEPAASPTGLDVAA